MFSQSGPCSSHSTGRPDFLLAAVGVIVYESHFSFNRETPQFWCILPGRMISMLCIGEAVMITTIVSDTSWYDAAAGSERVGDL